MAAAKNDPTGKDPEGADAAAAEESVAAAAAKPAVPPGLRYLVTYPDISVHYQDGDKDVHVVVPRNRYLDEFIPADVAAEKGKFLMSISHVKAVSFPA